jgi:hypothetical protein
MAEHVTVRPKRGGLVHLTSIDSSSAGLTLCRLPCDGWIIADAAPTCKRCLAREGGAP